MVPERHTHRAVKGGKMRSDPIRIAVLAALSGGSLGLAQTADAQTEEIIVTATRRETSVQDTALAITVRDRMMDRWVQTARTHLLKNVKTVCYFSAEFLMGPQLGNNLINLDLYDEFREALRIVERRYEEPFRGDPPQGIFVTGDAAHEGVNGLVLRRRKEPEPEACRESRSSCRVDSLASSEPPRHHDKSDGTTLRRARRRPRTPGIIAGQCA